MAVTTNNAFHKNSNKLIENWCFDPFIRLLQNHEWHMEQDIKE